MGAPIALFVVLPIVLLILVGLVLVVRGLFFGAKEAAEGAEQQVDNNGKRRGFFG